MSKTRPDLYEPMFKSAAERYGQVTKVYPRLITGITALLNQAYKFLRKGPSNGKLFAAASEFFQVVDGILSHQSSEQLSLITPRTPSFSHTRPEPEPIDLAQIYCDWTHCLLKYAEIHRLDADRWRTLHEKAGNALEAAFKRNPDIYNSRIDEVFALQGSALENEFHLAKYSPSLLLKLQLKMEGRRSLSLNECYSFDLDNAVMIANCIKGTLTSVTFDECHSMSDATLRKFVSICTNIEAISLVKCHNITDEVHSSPPYCSSPFPPNHSPSFLPSFLYDRRLSYFVL